MTSYAGVYRQCVHLNSVVLGIGFHTNTGRSCEGGRGIAGVYFNPFLKKRQ